MEKGRKLPNADHSRKVKREGCRVMARDKRGEREYEVGNEQTASLLRRMMK